MWNRARGVWKRLDRKDATMLIKTSEIQQRCETATLGPWTREKPDGVALVNDDTLEESS